MFSNYTQLSTKSKLVIHIKTSGIDFLVLKHQSQLFILLKHVYVMILTLMRRMNFMLSWTEHSNRDTYD